MPKAIAFILPAVLFVACNRGPILIAEYSIPFDSHYKLLHEKNDTNFGVIRGRDMRVYYSYSEGKVAIPVTKQEYLADGDWKEGAYAKAPPPADNAYHTYEAKDIKLLATRPPATHADSVTFHDADVIATCKLGDKTFLYGITFPRETFTHRFLIDTIDNHYRKIVIANNPKTGITAVYLTNLDKQLLYLNIHVSLLVATDSITRQQQDSLVRVFKRVSIVKERL